MELQLFTQDSPCEQYPDTELPNLYPPPLSRGSGVVVESPLLDPGLLCQEVREQLDVHIQRKRLHLLWGLPHIIQSSLEIALPSLPAFLVCTALQETSGHQRPLFKAERRQCLERHMREKVMHHKWGLPKRIQKVLKWPLLSGPASTLHSSCFPQRDIAAAAQTWALKVESGTYLQKGSATQRAEEVLSLDLVPLHLLMPMEPQEAPLVPKIGELGDDCSDSSLDPTSLNASSANVELALLDGSQSTTGVPTSKIDFWGWDKQQLKRPKPGISQNAAFAGMLPLAQATHLKPAGATKKPFSLPEASTQSSSNLTNYQNLWAQASYTSDPRLQSFVHTEKRITRAKETLSMATFLPGKGALGQAQSLQSTKWLEQGQMQSMPTTTAPAFQVLVHQDSIGLTGCSSGVPHQKASLKPGFMNLLEKTHWEPSPARVRQGVFPTSEKRMNSEAHSSQTIQIFHQGSQGVKTLPAGDKKQYFEFHLREKLLHQRWGVPKKVQESLSRCALLEAASL